MSGLRLLTIVGIFAASTLVTVDVCAAVEPDDLEGNWIVTYSGYKGGEAAAALAVSRTYRVICGERKGGGCVQETIRDETSEPTIRDVDNFTQGNFFVSGSRPGLTIRHGIGFLGGYYSHSDGFSGGPDSFTATWTLEDGSNGTGVEHWRRVQSVPRQFTYRSKGSDTVDPTGIGLVEMDYDSFIWGPENNIRGSRPTFDVEIRGDNLWGHHVLAFHDTVGLEIGRYEPIWRKGVSWTDPTQVLGIRFTVVVWPGVTPGVKVLYVDGKPYPFQFVMKGYLGKDDTCFDITDPLAGEPNSPADAYGDPYRLAMADRFGALQGTIEGATSEKTRQAAIADLRQTMVELAKAIRTRVADDPDPEATSREQQLFDGMNLYLKEIAPTPALPSPTQPSPVAQLSDYANHYLPSYPSGSPMGVRVEAWKAALRSIADHRARFGGTWQQVVAWQAEEDRLEAQLVLAEEEIVWTADGARYTPEEIEMVRPGFVRLAEARQRAVALAKVDARAAELRDLLSDYEQYYNALQQAFATGQGQYFGPAAAISMAHMQCTDTLRKVDAQADALRSDVAAAVGDLAHAFAAIIEHRRERGWSELQRRLDEQAAAAGLSPPGRIQMHRPRTPAQFEALAQQVSESFEAQVSGGTPLPLPESQAVEFFRLPTNRTLLLDSAELDRLLH